MKSKKPWYRWRNVFLTLLAFVVVIALVGVWAYAETRRLMNAEPNLSVDCYADLFIMRREQIGMDDETADEAWAVLVSAFEAGHQVNIAGAERARNAGFEPRHEFDDSMPDYSLVLVGPSVSSDVAHELTCIQEMRAAGVFDGLQEFVELAPGCQPPVSDDEMLWYDLLDQHRWSSEVLGARRAAMRVNTADGAFDDVVKAFDQLLAVAHTFSYDVYFYSYFGLSNSLLNCQELQHLLHETAFDQPACRELMSSLDRWPLSSSAFRIECLRANFHDSLRRKFSDDGQGGGYMIPEEISFTSTLKNLREAAKCRFQRASRTELSRLADEFFGEVIRTVQLPPQRRQTEGFDQRVFEQRLHDERHEFLITQLPTVHSFLAFDLQQQLEWEGTRIMLALEIYHARHGQFPAALEELVPDILDELPPEPVGNERWGYRLSTDDPDGRAYLLYTFGLDGQDDAGLMDNHKMHHAIRSDALGHDWVVNTVRP